MGRATRGGLAGSPFVSGVQVGDLTTLTAAENENITIDPTGTGILNLSGDTLVTSQADLRFGDSDNSNYVGFQAPATVSSNLVWTLPAADGAANTYLKTDGSGNLTFDTPGAAITDNTADATTNYVLFNTLTSGSLTDVRVSSSKLTYQPSTGTLRGDVINDSKGEIRNVPQNSQGGSYTLVASDAGKHISTTNTVTVPPSVFAVGDCISIYNNGSGTISLNRGSGVTMYFAGDGSNANRSIENRGFVTVVCVGSNTFVASGAGLA